LLIGRNLISGAPPNPRLIVEVYPDPAGGQGLAERSWWRRLRWCQGADRGELDADQRNAVAEAAGRIHFAAAFRCSPSPPGLRARCAGDARGLDVASMHRVPQDVA